MDSRRIAAGAMLCAALLVAILNSSVSSCVPDDFGKCEKVREQVRVSWLGGGGKSFATVILADNQDTLKDNLLEFASTNPKSGWGDADYDLNAQQTQSTRVIPRTPAMLPLSKLTAVELDRAEAKILTNTRDESLNRSRQLALIAKERDRRANERALELARKLRPVAPIPVVVAQLAPVPAPAPQPGSADPYNAPAPSGTLVYIEPHTSVWYGVNDRGRRVSLLMNADKNLGLTMSIFGPDVQNVWNARPTGMGAPGSGANYFWTGRSRFKGVWRVRITNPNDFSVPYTLSTMNISEGGDLCRDCHGIIQDDQWEDCEHEGSFCDDLKDDYKS